MKFYEKIIMIDGTLHTEVESLLNNNTLTIPANITLAGWKKISLNGHEGDGTVLKFLDSGINVGDLSNKLLVLGSTSPTTLLYFDFNSKSFYPTTTDWKLGRSNHPWAELHSTSGYFSSLIPFGNSKLIGTSTNYWASIFVDSISSPEADIDTVNVKNLVFDPNTITPPLLPTGSRVFLTNAALPIAGAKINSTTTSISGGIRRNTGGSNWSATNIPVTWRYLVTGGVQQVCLQYFAKIDLASITDDHSHLLIPPPFDDYSSLEDDYLQLSYSGTPTYASGPSISPFRYDGNNKSYVLVQRTSNLQYLYIQITRFTQVTPFDTF
jgi:hypothetical protein